MRKHVAELCVRYGVTLIEDAPYRELRFSGEALPMVSSYCPEHSLVLRSFSKISAPGLRLGVVTGRSDWLAHLIKVKQASDLHTSLPMQATLLALLQAPEFNHHLANVRHHYQVRYEALKTALIEHLSETYCAADVHGGMFIWLPITGLDPMKVAQDALKKGVAVVPSNVFNHQPARMQAALRLNFSYATTDKLNEAAARLASVLI